MALEINIRANVAAFERDFSAFMRKQVPFATAQALTAVARKVQAAEQKAIEETFDNPNPFTRNAVGIKPARKNNLTATVFVKDIQAGYLAPSVFNEPQSLGKGKKIRTPVDIALNASHDIPKGKIKALMARPDVFMGVVHGVNGLWQRVSPPKQGKRHGRGAAPLRPGQKLRLLVAFTRPVHVKTKLRYFEKVNEVVAQSFNAEMEAAFKKALATAK
jgi:hypothetical protein